MLLKVYVYICTFLKVEYHVMMDSFLELYLQRMRLATCCRLVNFLAYF